MQEFRYTARNAQGKLVDAKRTAENADDLANALIEDGLMPIDIIALSAPKDTATKNSMFFSNTVKTDELQLFCRQMYSLTHAGIPIIAAVSRLSETTRNPRLCQVLSKVVETLNKGSSLEIAMAQFPDVFSNFFINLIAVGENTGNLDNIFLHLSDYLELEADIKKKVKTALRYPIMVMGAIVIALLVINVFVIPAFSKLYASLHGTLPLATRILLASSNFILNFWYLIILAIIAAIVGFNIYKKTPAGAIRWGYIQLKIPIVGWLVHRMLLARFARILSLVLRAGITVLDGIKMVGVSTNNAYVSKQILSVTELITRGNTISAAIDKTKLFPPLVIQMLILGEESGTIEQLLDQVADYYQREINYDFERLSDSIEPIMLCIIGVMVLILALGIYSPIWDLATVISKH